MQPLNPNSGKAQLVAMVHVHSNNALMNTAYNSLFATDTYTNEEAKGFDLIRKKLIDLSSQVNKEQNNPLLVYCRNASFVLKKEAVHQLEIQICKFSFVQKLISRALQEVEIYYRNGINCVELENVGAPYFIGNEIPLEELLILHVVARAIRKKYPEIQLGIQVLSCGELEALPIAIANDAFFVRSEASIFSGHRPEGETNNRGNLAKFFYLRNYLSAHNNSASPEKRRLPKIWCDYQKKHTVFSNELGSLKTWLDATLFQKIEGIVLTGSETGSDIAEADLIQAKESILHTKEKIKSLSGEEINFEIPLITGSGANIEMYKKYADYIILGTSLKKNNYWENEVDESRVKAMISRF